MTDNNPWRTFLARRANGVRELHVPTVITPEQREEGWLRAVDNIEREMKRQTGKPTDPDLQTDR